MEFLVTLAGGVVYNVHNIKQKLVTNRDKIDKIHQGTVEKE